MSSLQGVLTSLEAITRDAERYATELVQQARHLNTAASHAASVSRATSRGDGRETAAALHSAQRAVFQAAQQLHQAAIAGRGFIQRQATAAASTSSGTGGGPIDIPARSAEPSLPVGIAYSDVSTRSLFGHVPFGYGSAQQGQLGDCFLIASLCAVAGTEPGTLRNSLTRRASDGRVTCGTESHEDTLPTDGSGDIYGTTPDGSSWVGHFEKAYAGHLGGYDKLGEGGWPSAALQWITGRESRTVETATLGDSDLGSVLTSGRPTVATCSGPPESNTALAREYQVVYQGAHAYAVKGIDTDGNVRLHNPWGQFHPKPMPIAVFRELFWRIDTC